MIGIIWEVMNVRRNYIGTSDGRPRASERPPSARWGPGESRHLPSVACRRESLARASKAADGLGRGPAARRWRHPTGGRLAPRGEAGLEGRHAPRHGSRELGGSLVDGCRERRQRPACGPAASRWSWVSGAGTLLTGDAPAAPVLRFAMARCHEGPSGRRVHGSAQRAPCQDCGYYPAHLAISAFETQGPIPPPGSTSRGQNWPNVRLLASVQPMTQCEKIDLLISFGRLMKSKWGRRQ